MRELKKLSLCLFSILAASVAVSAQAEVFSPRVAKHGGAYVSVEAFDVKATDTFLSEFPYATVERESTGTAVQNDIIQRLYFDPDRDWGYRVALGYDYPSCCPCNYGFSLEYTYFNTDDHRHFSVPVGTNTFGNVDIITPRDINTGGIFDAVSAKFDSKFYTIDLLAHANRVVCNCVDTQFFIGARYLRLKESIHEHFTSDQPIVIVPDVLERDDLTVNFSNRFNGIGPRVGVAGFYPFYRNLGLTAEVAGNLIFGCSRSKYSEVVDSFTPEAVPPTFVGSFNENYKDHEKFVPGWSGKIGLAYHVDFRNCSSLNIEVGYRGDKYYEISNIKTWIDAISSDTDSSVLKNGTYQDFEFSGPYISLSYHA